ncbi:MAG: SsrA-binding protein [SAR202 cluster bacterium Io17-Chloro-G7]|nr:MAG: SsrA-binding protein [SAR202 cluster bacterium Io17-Chloro-G7]
MAKSAKKKADGGKSNGGAVATNRRAFFDYEILDRREAGLVLTGTEIKSARAGKVDLREAYARPLNGELWLMNVHIATYDPANIYNHEPKRSRKLLLHKDEITHLAAEVAEKRLTIIPLRMYIKNHVAKVEIAVARGKRQYDKRRAIMDKEMDLAARRALRSEE